MTAKSLQIAAITPAQVKTFASLIPDLIRATGPVRPVQTLNLDRMTDARVRLTQPHRRLPDLALATPSGAPRRLRSGGRRSPVLVLVHPGGCAACAELVQRLHASSAVLLEWDGDVLVVTPDLSDGEDDPSSTAPFPILLDPEQRLASSLGVTPPAVVIADQWGEVHEVTEAGDGHRFPGMAEVESWLRYLATLCPECQGEAL